MKLFGKNKRGIELAVNFLVTFILAIVIFGAGIVLIKQMVGSSEQDFSRIQGDLDQRIQALSCSSKDKLCLSNNEATVGRGKVLYFTANVNNYLSQSMNFTITILEDSKKGYSGDTEIPKESIQIKPLPATQTMEVRPKQQQSKAFAMVIPKNVVKGQYFYTIRVEGREPFGNVSDTLIFTVK